MMKPAMKTLASLSLVLALSACVTATQDVTPAAKNTGLFGMAKGDMDVTSAKAFSGKKDVIIGGFKVSFVTEHQQTNSTRQHFLSSGAAGHASAHTTLTGVSPAAMQALTDAAYSDFVSRLKAAGYNVVPATNLYQSKEFATIKQQETPFETKKPLLSMKGEATVFSPTHMPLSFLPNQGDGMGGFGKSSPLTAYMAYAGTAGTPVLDVFYVVNYAGFGGHRSVSSASVSVGHGMSVAAGSTVSIFGGQAGSFSSNNGTITLGQPVNSEKSFATVEELTSGAEKVAGYAINTAVGLLGSAKSIHRKYEVRANEGQYKAAAKDSLTKANAAFAAHMASLR